MAVALEVDAEAGPLAALDMPLAIVASDDTAELDDGLGMGMVIALAAAEAAAPAVVVVVAVVIVGCDDVLSMTLGRTCLVGGIAVVGFDNDTVPVLVDREEEVEEEEEEEEEVG